MCLQKYQNARKPSSVLHSEAASIWTWTNTYFQWDLCPQTQQISFWRCSSASPALSISRLLFVCYIFFRTASPQRRAQPSASHMPHVLPPLLLTFKPTALFGLPLRMSCHSASLGCAQRIFLAVSSTGGELCTALHFSQHRAHYGIEGMNTEALMVWHLGF